MGAAVGFKAIPVGTPATPGLTIQRPQYAKFACKPFFGLNRV
jgi:hypothetical protein